MTFYKAFPVAPGVNFCSCFSDKLKASPREREKEKQTLFPSPNKDSKAHCHFNVYNKQTPKI